MLLKRFKTHSIKGALNKSNMKIILILFLSISLQSIIIPLTSLNNAYLGVYLEDLTEFEKREKNIREGVRVVMVIIDSPADRQSILPNDVILRINDMPISEQDQVRTIIRHSHPGDILELEVLSRGQRRSLTVNLDDLSDIDTTRIRLFETKTKHIGIKLQNITEQLREFFQAEHGILIAEIVSGSPAETAGLKAGDVITHAVKKPVFNVNDLKDLIQTKELGEAVTIDYLRQGRSFQTKVEVAEADELFSYDSNDEIIFLGSGEAKTSQLSNWFNSVLSDTTKKELERQIRMLEEELEKLHKQLTDK